MTIDRTMAIVNKDMFPDNKETSSSLHNRELLQDVLLFSGSDSVVDKELGGRWHVKDKRKAYLENMWVNTLEKVTLYDFYGSRYHCI